MNTAPKPAWRDLYLQGAVGLTLLFIVPLLNVSEDMQNVAFIVITVALCVAMRLWISDNSAALAAESASVEEIQSIGRYYTLHPGAPSARTSTNDHEMEVA